MLPQCSRLLLSPWMLFNATSLAAQRKSLPRHKKQWTVHGGENVLMSTECSVDTFNWHCDVVSGFALHAMRSTQTQVLSSPLTL
ncbi:hypothetical protein P154DRAFT_42399 [Amniculicola lignicola CBS 123094]|uniref:Secreted protein n=1 Tax=Amniculicola lignicola CBS 123094 TaxID=1392246 RepID=A0A6A5WRT8_9PLEO|nr:hypothetical protein P154DRAFT_42399 [Amniculicola lignicola CBS 123094]